MTLAYVFLALAGAFVLRRFATGWLARKKIPEILKEGAQIIDVRTPSEFASGHASNSRNIPLGELAAAAGSLDPQHWVVVCCASGARSGVATRMLRRRGFRRVLNAGSWRNLP